MSGPPIGLGFRSGLSTLAASQLIQERLDSYKERTFRGSTTTVIADNVSGFASLRIETVDSTASSPFRRVRNALHMRSRHKPRTEKVAFRPKLEDCRKESIQMVSGLSSSDAASIVDDALREVGSKLQQTAPDIAQNLHKMKETLIEAEYQERLSAHNDRKIAKILRLYRSDKAIRVTAPNEFGIVTMSGLRSRSCMACSKNDLPEQNNERVDYLAKAILACSRDYLSEEIVVAIVKGAFGKTG